MQISDIKHVVKLLQSGVNTFKSNPTLDRIFTDEAVGRKINKYWVLSTADVDALRLRVSKYIGQDPREKIDFDKPRAVMAEQSVFEKLSSRQVFADAVLLARPTPHAIPIKSPTAMRLYTPDGCFIGCAISDLLLSDDNKYIVVENGTLMMYWHRLKLPESWSTATFIYRGHGSNASAVKDFANSVDRANIAFFYDFDPAGLSMAISSGHNFIVPAKLGCLIRQPEYAKINQTDLHFSQLDALRSSMVPPEHPAHLYQRMMLDNRIAIMQEHMIAYSIQLAVIPGDK